MTDWREPVCHLAYPSLAQHFVNGLAFAARSLHLSDGYSPIPVENTPTLGVYRSAIALSLKPQKAGSLAQDLTAIAHKYLKETLNHPYQIHYSNEGWIKMTASPYLQWACLSQLAREEHTLEVDAANFTNAASLGNEQTSGAQTSTKTPHSTNHRLNETITPDLSFELQYAHARCCSVLRFAQEKSPLNQSISTQWLNAYLRHNLHETEHHLIMSLLNFPSQLQTSRHLRPTIHNPAQLPKHETLALLQLFSPLPNKRLHAIAQEWAQLFQNFYGSGQICHLTLPEDQDLFKLRVTLFQALRRILAFLLVQIFNQTAPQIL